MAFSKFFLYPPVTMSEKEKYLLPPGFRDITNEQAEIEFWALSKILGNFAAWSYKQISTPLVEYTDSLFSGTGGSLEEKTIRLEDPQTQKAMGIRSDITTQISRLVESRLKNQETPLRLCYYGDIIRKFASNTRGDRQLKQVGLELLTDSENIGADAEVIVIALDSLQEIGLKDITLDLNTPGLVNKLGDYDQETINNFIKRDISGLPEELKQLVELSGNAEAALSIDSSQMSNEAITQIEYLKAVYDKVLESGLDVNVTIDFVEDKGFEYQNSLGFSFFAKGIKDEIGRGGKYTINSLFGCGFTLYINSFLDNLQPLEKPQETTVEANVNFSEIKKLQKSGKIVKKNLSA